MALTPFCTEDEVRAALGNLSEVELPDSVIGLEIYELGLRRELRQISGALPAAFSQALAAEPRTTAQEDLYAAVREFSAYAAARLVGTGLGLLAPKGVTDEKAGIDRFASDPYKDVLQRLDARYNETRQALISVFALQEATTTSAFTLPALFAISTPNNDPVTGS